MKAPKSLFESASENKKILLQFVMKCLFKMLISVIFRLRFL